MALASSRPRNPLNDENSLPTGKTQANGAQGAGRAGLKQQQQSTTNERRILSDISNARPLSSFGTPKPSPKPPGGLAARKSENVPPSKPAPGLPSSSLKQQQQQRVPLRTIVNESQGSLPKSSAKQSQKEKAPEQQKKKSVFPKVTLTPEQIAQCEEWAKEDLPIEQVHFTGDDMEALREKMVEAEIEENVALVRNFHPTGHPAFRMPKVPDYADPIYFEDGRLKPDLLRGHSFDEVAASDPFDIDALGVGAGSSSLEEDPLIITALSDMPGDFQYPCIPEDWHHIRDEGGVDTT